jgi:hypothetical protein
MRTNNRNIGHIYILSNPAMPGLLKIGFTKKSTVSERADELSKNTAIPLPFVVEYDQLVDRPNFTESRLHRELKKYRISYEREFFRTDVDTAIIAINKVLFGKDNLLFSLNDSVSHLIELYEAHPEEFTKADIDIEAIKLALSRSCKHAN